MNKIDSFYLKPVSKEEAEPHKLDIKHYLTYYSSNYEDKAMKKEMLKLWPYATALFSLRKNSAAIYRGLSYSQKHIEAYISLLIKLLSKGFITSNEFRSWTLDKAVAEAFAYHDPHTIQGHNTMNYVGGCTLKASVKGEYAIDMDYAGASDYSEDEILVPPGTYQCSVLNAIVFSVKDSALSKPFKQIDFEDMHVLSYKQPLMARHCATVGIFVEELSKSDFLKALLSLQKDRTKLKCITLSYNQYAYKYL